VAASRNDGAPSILPLPNMRGAMPGQAFDFDFGNILYFSYYSEEYKHHDSDSSMGCSPMGYLPYACLSLVISKIGVVTN
jgi:hypothetical protein